MFLILRTLKQILTLQEKIMSTLTDLQGKLAAVSTAVTKLSSDVDAFIAAHPAPAASDADLQALSATVDQVSAAVAAIDTKVAPPTA